MATSLDSEKESLKLLDIFRKFDNDGNGTIGKEELSQILKDTDANWSDERTNELFEGLDVNRDNRVDIAEFVKFVWSEDVTMLEGHMHGCLDAGGKLAYADFGKIIANLHIEDIKESKEYFKVFTNKIRANWKKGVGSEAFMEATFHSGLLTNAIFVGHVNTDLDSIAGAICAAELFAGIPARAEETWNGEIDWALKYVEMEAPQAFADIPGGAIPEFNTASNPRASNLYANGRLRKVCLVDHNEVDQMTKALKDDPQRMKRIVGLIDHHAIAKSFFTPSPLFMDIRPWGSMCTIVFHMYLRNRAPIRKEIARLLLCAILSDTLNLRSGTTTNADRFSVALLSSFGEVDDVDALAMNLFEAKTGWIVGLGAYEMVRGDQKNFVVGDVRWSIAVLEVTAMDAVLAVAEDILCQLKIFKYEKGDYIDNELQEKCHDVDKECHCALLFIVDTVKQCSVALISGGREKWLAEKAFPKATWRAAAVGVRSPSPQVKAEETLCDCGSLVSRKLEFMPLCSDALSSDVPDWFYNASSTQQRLAQVLESDNLQPMEHNSVQVVWDKDLLKAAVFYTEADKSLLRKRGSILEGMAPAAA